MSWCSKLPLSRLLCTPRSLSLHQTVLTQRDHCSRNAVIVYQQRRPCIKVILTLSVLTKRVHCMSFLMHLSCCRPGRQIITKSGWAWIFSRNWNWYLALRYLQIGALFYVEMKVTPVCTPLLDDFFFSRSWSPVQSQLCRNCCSGDCRDLPHKGWSPISTAPTTQTSDFSSP